MPAPRVVQDIILLFHVRGAGRRGESLSWAIVGRNLFSDKEIPCPAMGGRRLDPRARLFRTKLRFFAVDGTTAALVDC